MFKRQLISNFLFDPAKIASAAVADFGSDDFGLLVVMELLNHFFNCCIPPLFRFDQAEPFGARFGFALPTVDAGHRPNNLHAGGQSLFH